MEEAVATLTCTRCQKVQEDCECTESPAPLSTVGSKEVEFKSWAGALVAYRCQYGQRLPRQIEPSQMWTKQLVSCWNDICEQSNRWCKVPSSMLLGNQPPNIERAYLACSLAYYSQVSGDRAALVAAYNIYGSNLRRQRQQLASRVVPSESDICNALALSCFETVASPATFGIANYPHFLAAEKMLAMLGPEACSRSEELFLIFLLVRIETAHIAIRARKPTIFAQRDWQVIFPIDRPPEFALFNRLRTVVLFIPSLMERLDNLASHETSESQEAERTRIRDDALLLLSETDDISSALRPLTRRPHLGKPDASTPQDFYWEPPPESACKTTSPNMMLAHHASTTLLVLAILRELDDDPQSLYALRFLHVSTQVLFQSEALRELELASRWAVCVWPLTVIGIWSPDETHRESARQMLETLGSAETLAGFLCRGHLATLKYGDVPLHKWTVEEGDEG